MALAQTADLGAYEAPLAVADSDGKVRQKPGRKPGSVPLNNELSPDEFFALQDDMTEADWAKACIYVWRRDPFTDTTNGGRDPKYIDVIARPISEEILKELHGSGTYRVHLNRNDKYAGHTVLSVEDPKHPPHIPPGDWLNNPRNKRWQSWKPLVEKWWDGELKKLTNSPTYSQNTTGDGVPAWAVDIMRRQDELFRRIESPQKDALTTSLVPILPALLNSASAANDPARMITALKDAKEFMGAAPEPKENPLMTLLIDEVKSLRESNTRLMEKMLDMKSEQVKQPGALDQVKTMAELITTVGGIVQPAAPREPWENVVSEVGPKLLDTIQTVGTAWAARRPVTMPARVNLPNPAATAPVAVQTTVQPEPPAESQNTPEGMDTMQASMILNVAAFAAQALNLGLTGDHFAEQVCYKFGSATYDSFIAQFPKETLLNQFKAVPQAWQLLQPHENLLPEFIESFYAYAEEPEEAETKSTSSPKPKGKKK